MRVHPRRSIARVLRALTAAGLALATGEGRAQVPAPGGTGATSSALPAAPDTTGVVAALRTALVPLAAVTAGAPTGDLAAFGRAVGDARLVALGEASHGTREIFQLKHRLFEYLVREKGFTVFVLEANWPESDAVDRYVKTGEGDPREALKAMYFWTWQTEEVLALVEWMRAYNRAPGKHPILSFSAFDMQYHEGALDQLLVAVRGTPEASRVEAALAGLRGLSQDPWRSPALRPLADSADAVVALLTERRAAPRTVQLARVVARALRNRTMEDRDYRDGVMAENVRWLLDVAHPREKVVVWGHNSHVSTVHTPQFAGGRGTRYMGHVLREALGRQMYVLGFALDSGTVRARRVVDGKMTPAMESRLPPAGAGTGTAVLRAAGVPRFFLDLRATRGPLRTWLDAEHAFQEIGAGWPGEVPPPRERVLTRGFDGLVFLQGTSASRAF